MWFRFQTCGSDGVSTSQPPSIGRTESAIDSSPRRRKSAVRSNASSLPGARTRGGFKVQRPPCDHRRSMPAGTRPTLVRTYVRLMIVCVLLPRFELTVAAGERDGLLKMPAALAPEPGGVERVGRVALSAEGFGIHPGMALGEALASCPRLTLIPPDPVGVADLWERLLVRLESIGAAVEPERPGLGCFEARGLLRLHGGLDGVLAAARRALRIPARYGAAPSRFAAVVPATRARIRTPVGHTSSATRGIHRILLRV